MGGSDVCPSVESGVRSTGAGAEGESRATACCRDGHHLDVCPEGAAEGRRPRSSGGLRDRGPGPPSGRDFSSPPSPREGAGAAAKQRYQSPPREEEEPEPRPPADPQLLRHLFPRACWCWGGGGAGYSGRRARTSSASEVGALFFVGGGSSGPGRSAGQMATGLSRRSQRGLGLPGPPPPAARSRSRPSRAAPWGPAASAREAASWTSSVPGPGSHLWAWARGGTRTGSVGPSRRSPGARRFTRGSVLGLRASRFRGLGRLQPRSRPRRTLRLL